ncbi:MAG: ADOP family duplicated permease [Vicinamibacterales bacterium]
MPRFSPPRLALWIIERATPPRDRDAVVGDVIEDYRRLSETNPAAARRWCRRQALRSVVPGLRRQCGDGLPDISKGRFSMRGFVRDLAFGMRLLRQQPLMAAAGVLSLAVGLGLNVLLFTLANAILYRPLPVTGADRLVMVQMRHEQGVAMDFSYPSYLHLRDAATDVFDTFVAYSSPSVSARVANGLAQSLEGEYVTGNFFMDLGVPMASGRPLTTADDRPEAPPSIVVSDAFWRKHYGNAPLSGQTVLMNETHFTIVGVADARFFGTEIGRTADFWVTIGQMYSLEREDYRNKSTSSWLALMGRLKPGVTREAAEARLRPAATAFFEPRFGSGVRELVLAEGSQGDSDLPRNIGEPLRLLVAASLFVLLIACVNVANLQLARVSTRRQELAVRSALGAGRGRLISLLLADALILTVPAGMAAIAAAALLKDSAARLIARWGDPVTLSAPIDLRVAGAALGMTAAAALIVGGLSAWLSTRRAPSLALAEGGRAGIGGAAKTQRALVIVQFALSMTLIAVAGLLIRTVDELRSTDLGFNRNIALFDVAPGQRGYTRETLGRYYADAFDKVRQVPGVEAAAIAHVMPLDFGGSRETVDIAGYTPGAGEDMELNNIRVSPGYFSVLGIPLVAGREFDDRDAGQQITKIIVNETLAKRFWPNGRAVGGFVRMGRARPGRTHSVEVIGVAADVRYRMVREDRRPTFYMSTSQAPIGFFTLHVRTTGSPEAGLGEIERALASVDPGVPVARAFTLNGQLDRNIATERMARSIAMALGVAALILAATGLYATMAFAVRRRTREIGLRMALGARTSDVSRMIVRQGFVLVALGTVAGAAGAFWAGRTIESQLYGVSSADAASFIAAASVLAAAAMLATWIPARRATRVDPVIALRDQ